MKPCPGYREGGKKARSVCPERLRGRKGFPLGTGKNAEPPCTDGKRKRQFGFRDLARKGESLIEEPVVKRCT